MNVSQKGNSVLAMDVARDDQELLVVTENGYGKRTPISDYPVKGRGTMGVKTITLTENKGQLAGALVVREHQELVFISQNGMVQRTSVRGINRYGRASQGVRVMNIRDDDQVSAVALVVESEAETAATVAGDGPVSVADDTLPAAEDIGLQVGEASAADDSAPDDDGVPNDPGAPDDDGPEGDGE
jgi:DNA gyrase subunit A